MSQQGFTLMEIIVATSIFATTLTMMFTLFTYTLKINRQGEALRQATQGMRNFAEFLTKEVRNGKIDYAVGSVLAVPQCNEESYSAWDRSLGIVNLVGERECIYYTETSPGQGKIMIQKENTNPYELNPPNFNVKDMKVFVRPKTDPYSGTPPPGVQPFVTIAITFEVALPGTGVVTIPYQTTISTDVYDVP